MVLMDNRLFLIKIGHEKIEESELWKYSPGLRLTVTRKVGIDSEIEDSEEEIVGEIVFLGKEHDLGYKYYDSKTGVIGYFDSASDLDNDTEIDITETDETELRIEYCLYGNIKGEIDIRLLKKIMIEDIIRLANEGGYYLDRGDKFSGRVPSLCLNDRIEELKVLCVLDKLTKDINENR